MSQPINDRPDRELTVGIARGGPLDGREVHSRFPKGVLAVDKQSSKVWVYDYAEGEFQVREPDGRTLENDRRWHAVEGADFDVVVP